MRRRRLFNFAAGISAALLLATLALWARGRWTWLGEGIDLAYSDDPQTVICWQIGNSPFGVTVGRSRNTDLAEHIWRAGPRRFTARPMPTSESAAEHWTAAGGHGTAGIWWLAVRDYPSATGTGYASHFALILPHWTLSALTALLPAAWMVERWRRRRWIAAGRCANCGYDLRATPQRCPECGAAPPAGETLKDEC